jgi:hypothetical protein
MNKHSWWKLMGEVCFAVIVINALTWVVLGICTFLSWCIGVDLETLRPGLTFSTRFSLTLIPVGVLMLVEAWRHFTDRKAGG